MLNFSNIKKVKVLKRKSLTIKKYSRNNNKSSKGKKIKNSLILSYILIVSIPLVLVNAFSTVQSKHTVKTTTSQMAIEVVKQVANNLNYYISDLEKSVMRITINELNASSQNILNEYLSIKGNDVRDNLLRNNAEKVINQQLMYSSTIDENIQDVALILNDDTILGGITGLSKEEQLSLKQDIEVGEYVWQVGVAEHPDDIFVVTALSNLKVGSKVGNIALRVNIKNLEAQIQDIRLLENSTVTILNEEGKSICNSNDEGNITENMMQFINADENAAFTMMDDKLVAFSTGNNGWKIVLEIPEDELTSRIDIVGNVVWIIVLVAILIAIFIGIVFSKALVKAIQKMVQAMKKAEAGDLTEQLVMKREDEFLQLENSFNQMMANMRRLLEETKQTMSSSFDTGSKLKESMTNSLETFEQLASSIENIAVGSVNQAEDTQNSSSAMEKLSKRIQEVIDDTSRISNHTKGTEETIGLADKNMEQLSTTMQSSLASSQLMQESMMELNDLTKGISAIMGLLENISGQTNLLALNASIEAARVGEAGKGFAVVANEVRNLAEESKASTLQVREAIKNIEVKMSDVSGIANEVSRTFNDQKQAVQMTQDSFKKMREELQKITEELKAVNAHALDMQSLKDEMNHRISNITSVTQENAATVEEVNALSEAQRAVMEQLVNMAESLMSQIDKLDSSIDAFKIK